METGFNAMGKPVPANRLQNGYKTVKDILKCDSETAALISRKVAKYIEEDNLGYVVGNLNGTTINGVADKLDEDLGRIDLIGRYRLLAVMLTD